MDKKKVKKWLDTVSDACRVLIDNQTFEEIMYSVSQVRCMHCFVTPEELSDMADSVDTLLLESPFAEDYKYKYSFFYNGIEFFCISKTKIAKREGF